jgi:hypothetical protein
LEVLCHEQIFVYTEPQVFYYEQIVIYTEGEVDDENFKAGRRAVCMPGRGQRDIALRARQRSARLLEGTS